MKTISEIEKEINYLMAESEGLSDYNPKESKIKEKNRKRISFLRTCIKYLQTNPRLEFVNQMLSEVKYKLSVYDKRLVDWKSSIRQDVMEKIANPNAYYYKTVAPKEKNEIKEAKQQLNTLNYLLS